MGLSWNEIPVGRFMRMKLRILKRCFLLLLIICLTVLLTLSIRRLLNNASVNLSSLVMSRADTTEQNDQFNLLQSNFITHEPIVKHHIHRTKLLCIAVCPITLFLLILVSSDVRNFERRQRIRNTWGTDFSINTRWKTVFLLGKNSNGKEMFGVSRETEMHGDIVQADYREHFWNMGYKVAMGFEWSVKYCRFNYLLKADDDVFVNTLGLMDFLKYTTPRSKLYTGNIIIGSVVLRDGSYAVSPEEYNETVYKPYCSGGGYVLSRDVVEKFLSYFDVLKPLKMGDAYIGLLADRAGVKVIHNEEFRMYENKCEYRKTTLVHHPATGDCVIKLYNNMTGLDGRIN